MSDDMSELTNDELTNDLSVGERMQQQRELHARLAGATESWLFEDPLMLRKAVLHLMSCVAHGGAHHFAVVGEGRGLVCSPTGTECIRAADLFSTDQKESHAPVGNHRRDR